MPRFDLKRPCMYCPFRSDGTGLRFACRERAEEVEESAYRNGWPCHESAEMEHDWTGEEVGYVFGRNTQHCIGYIIMQLKSGGSGSAWPGIDNDEDLLIRLESQIDWDAPVFESEDEFFEANTPKNRTA